MSICLVVSNNPRHWYNVYKRYCNSSRRIALLFNVHIIKYCRIQKWYGHIYHKKEPYQRRVQAILYLKTRARKHKTCSLLRSPEDYRQVEMLYAKKGCIYLSYDWLYVFSFRHVSGDAKLAICGGVSSIIGPQTFVPLCKARWVSTLIFPNLCCL